MDTSNSECMLSKEFENMWLSDDDFIIEESSENENEEEYQHMKEYEYCVLSIDIGIKHLGISVTLLNDDYSIIEIIWIDLIDIQKFVHKDGPSKKDCKLGHTKTFCDWINHVFQENEMIFENADIILIERQPPMGLVGIEQLIFSRWRDKSILISPNSMHKHFNIGYYDYEQRKYQTEKIAKKYLDIFSNMSKKFDMFERRHDISDSICMMLFWVNGKQKEYLCNKRKEELMERRMSIVYDRKKDGYRIGVNEWFEQFRYVGKYATEV